VILLYLNGLLGLLDCILVVLNVAELSQALAEPYVR